MNQQYQSSTSRMRGRKMNRCSAIYFPCLIICFDALLSLASLNSFAQSKFSFFDIKSKYPDKDLYYLKDREDLDISLDHDKLDMTARISSEFVFLNDRANNYSSHSIYYYDETEEVSNVKAFSYVPQDNNSYRKMEVTKVNVRKASKDGIFYDDLREQYFSFPLLKEGAVASFSYTEKFKDPHFLPSYFFGNYFATGSSELVVSFPREVTVKYLLRGDTALVHFSETKSGSKIIYTWKADNVPSYADEADEGNWRIYNPHVILYIDQYKAGDKTVPVLSDVRQLHRWYYTHIRDLVEASDKNNDGKNTGDAALANVRSLADSLVRGLTDETAKIKAIYYWVQDNTRYIAFEEGLGGYVPRPAGLVCSRRFGDCKDKSSLLYAMFRAEGIAAYFTWIGTRQIPYSYSDLPSPLTNNHMIISLYRSGQWEFLDGTASGLCMGYPSDFIQEKEALISLGPDSFRIVKVPVVQKEKNFRTDSVSVLIDGDNLIGSGRTYYGGLWKTEIITRFTEVADNKKVEEMGKYFQFGNNKSKMDTIYAEGFDDYRDSLQFNYKFSVPSYIRKVDNKLFVNLQLRKSLQGDLIEMEKRKTEENYRFKYVNKQITELIIPEGYALSKLPDGSSFNGKSFGYQVLYTKEDKKVHMETVIYFDELLKMKSEFEEWNKMIDSLNEEYSKVVMLEKQN